MASRPPTPGGGDFRSTRAALQPRPWSVDHFDVLAARWERQPHKHAIMFVDNAGADFVLGALLPPASGSATALERLWDGCGAALERRWNGSGTALGRLWDGSGTALERLGHSSMAAL